MIKIWLYWIIRSKTFIYVAQSMLIVLVMLYAAWHAYANATLQFMGESLGLLIVVLSCQICFHLNGANELIVDSKPQIFLQKTLKSIVAGLIFATALFYLFPPVSPGYVAAVASAAFVLFGLLVLRPVVRALVRRHGTVEGTVIMGSEAMAEKVYHDLIKKESPERVRVIPSRDLGRLAHQDRVCRIVVTDPNIEQESELAEALIDCKLRGVKIENAVDCLEKQNRKIWTEGVSAEWLIFSDGFCPSKLYLFMKRAFDLALSLAVLIVAAPIMAIVAAAIKLDSSGPALFSQDRVGMFGRRFTVYKFRSMRQDAEKLTGPTWAKDNDERITRVGRILRKTRLDELPQVFNVFRGDMSLVGPRPERPYFVDLLKEKIRYYDLRHYVKPGITGWAQVMYPYGASVEDAHNKLQYDLYYVKHASLRLDILVLLKTITVVVAGEGR